MDDYGYADDFEEECESPVEVSKPTPLVSLPRLSKREPSPGTLDVTPLQVLENQVKTKRNSSYTKWKRKGRRLFSTPKALPQPAPSKNSTFSPRDREMSACKQAMRRLESKITQQQKQLEEARKDTKLMNRLRIRQEKDLNRFQSQEGELPQLLTRHAEEVRVLREHLKRSMDNSQTYQKQSNEYRQEILKLRDHTKRLETVASKKNLLGRDKLTDQLQLATNLVKDNEKKIVELERRLELEKKTHVSEIRSLIQRNRFLSTEIEEARLSSQRVHSKLKEKEKNLDIMNMYTQRFGKVAQRLSIAHTPPAVLSQYSQTQITCPATKGLSFHILPTPSSNSNEIQQLPPGPAKTCQTKSTQTTLNLNPKESSLELKVLNITHRVIDPLKAKHKAVQTSMEGSLSRPTTDVSVQTSENVTQLMTSNVSVAPAQMNKQLPGVSIDDSMEGERRKREELLAKLRKIDGIKNPPESQPIESAAARISSEKQQPFQSGTAISGAGKQGVVESRLDTQIEAVNKPSITSSQQKTQLDSALWNADQTSSNHPLQRSPLFQAELESSSNKPPERSPFDTSQGTNSPDRGLFDTSRARGTNPPDRGLFDTSQGTSTNQIGRDPFDTTRGTNPPDRGLYDTSQGTSNNPPPFSTSRSTTLQSNGSQAGVQNLLLGDSQPFQAGLMWNASRGTGYQSVNPPEKSPFNPDPVHSSAQATSNSPVGTTGPNHNSVSSKPQGPMKRSSLFNLTGGQSTKASTDLSTIMWEGRRATSPHAKLSSSLLQDEEQRGTVPLDLTRKFGSSDIDQSSKQKRGGVFKSTSRTSISTLRSWPDTVQNLHVGKPAYSTETDPFGSKHAAVLTRQSGASNEYKPVHGRRAGTLEEIPDNLGSISENHPGSTAHQKTNIKPRSGSQSYPWEVPIDVQSQDTEFPEETRSNRERTNSANKKASLLPFRPKQTSGFGTRPAPNYVAEPDDLEQVVL